MTSPKQEWSALEVTAPEQIADVIANFCHECGCSGLHLADEPGGLIRIIAYFRADEAAQSVNRVRQYLSHLAGIFSNLPEPTVVYRPVKTENWAVMWKDHFQSTPIGRRLLVTPPWLDPQPSGREVIVIEPAEAFGTGTHETTQGCLILLEKAINTLQKSVSVLSMLDVGCGSGILAIAAIKLGATHVLGADNDPIAVESARKNARLNRVETGLELVCVALQELSGQWDIVTANLDPRTLAEHADKLMALFEKFLIVSGVPLNQWDSTKRIFSSRRASLSEEITRSEWGCGLFEK